MAKKEIAVKKYVVELSAEERKRLEGLDSRWQEFSADAGASSDNIACDDEFGRHPDPHGELFTGAGLQAPYGFGDVQSRMDRARRSSSCARGKPKVARIPSPKNFATKPS